VSPDWIFWGGSPQGTSANLQMDWDTLWTWWPDGFLSFFFFLSGKFSMEIFTSLYTNKTKFSTYFSKQFYKIAWKSKFLKSHCLSLVLYRLECFFSMESNEKFPWTCVFVVRFFIQLHQMIVIPFFQFKLSKDIPNVDYWPEESHVVHLEYSFNIWESFKESHQLVEQQCPSRWPCRLEVC
jgi:hypothetical protein